LCSTTYRSISAASAQADGFARARPPPTTPEPGPGVAGEGVAGGGAATPFAWGREPRRLGGGASFVTVAFSSRQLRCPKHASFTTGQG